MVLNVSRIYFIYVSGLISVDSWNSYTDESSCFETEVSINYNHTLLPIITSIPLVSASLTISSYTSLFMLVIIRSIYLGSL